MNERSINNTKRPVIFLAVGLGNTLLDFSFYTLLTLTIYPKESDIAFAGLISGIFALMCAFATHSLITWRGSYIDRMTLVRFFVFTGVGMWVLRPTLLILFSKLSSIYEWGFSLSQWLRLPFDKEFVSHTGAFGLMIVIVLAYNYFVYEKFVFKRSSSAGHIEPKNRLAS